MERKEGGVAFKENDEIDKAERMRGNPPIKRSPTHAAIPPIPIPPDCADEVHCLAQPVSADAEFGIM